MMRVVAVMFKDLACREYDYYTKTLMVSYDEIMNVVESAFKSIASECMSTISNDEMVKLVNAKIQEQYPYWEVFIHSSRKPFYSQTSPEQMEMRHKYNADDVKQSLETIKKFHRDCRWRKIRKFFEPIKKVFIRLGKHYWHIIKSIGQYLCILLVFIMLLPAIAIDLIIDLFVVGIYMAFVPISSAIWLLTSLDPFDIAVERYKKFKYDHEDTWYGEFLYHRDEMWFAITIRLFRFYDWLAEKMPKG